jgi:cobalamin biosynthesis Mg chelatase CobN
VLALLALALFPVCAFANAGETVYETEVPTIESEPGTGNSAGNSPAHHKPKNNAQAEGSAAHETGGTSTGGEAEVEEGSSEGHKKEGSSSEEEEGKSSTGGGGNGGGGNKSGGANAGGPEGSIGEQKDLGGTAQGKNVAESSGGSSPVVPILIAVVVLAAISIGVVLYRQRKSDQDGSDGRASSPSAS